MMVLRQESLSRPHAALLLNQLPRHGDRSAHGNLQVIRRPGNDYQLLPEDSGFRGHHYEPGHVEVPALLEAERQPAICQHCQQTFQSSTEDHQRFSPLTSAFQLAYHSMLTGLINNATPCASACIQSQCVCMSLELPVQGARGKE
eukprot:scpid83688/ scgid29338/ 